MSRPSNQAAHFLRDQGCVRGDRLLLLLGNVGALWELMLGAMKIGAIVIPATTLLTAEELEDRAREVGSGLFLRHKIRWQNALAFFPKSKRLK